MTGSLKLYTFWRSQASYRVRIALALKGVAFEGHPIDLLKGEQGREEYKSLNPGMAVPTLIDGEGAPLLQSLAILEYLDEKYPNPPLLPADLRDRAHVRALAQLLAIDVHPLIVPRVRKYLESELGLDEAARTKWLRHWMEAGNRAVETLLANDPRTGRFCCGDSLTMADLCLVAHVTSALMLYDCDMRLYPTAQRIVASCMEIDAFATTRPSAQPGASGGH